MYKVRAVFSERITDDISDAKIIAFERIKLINKGCNLQKIEHANKFLLTGFEVTVKEYEDYLNDY